jgi:hypothetical protein
MLSGRRRRDAQPAAQETDRLAQRRQIHESPGLREHAPDVASFVVGASVA